MRPSHAAAAAAILAVMTAAILVGGQRLAAPVDEISITPEDIPVMPEAGFDDEAVGADAPTAAIEQGEADRSFARSRAVDAPTVAPPPAGVAPLERAEPRPPLSELSLALPPKPKPPVEGKGTPLFQPLASAAGVVQGAGYNVAIAGVDAVMPDETCTDDTGKVWNCGVRARSAFRAFLRGRAPVCAVPPEGGRDTISAACHIGKQDLGAWLVGNGWARAAAAGPYVQAEAAARRQRIGIFGAAPDLSNLPPAPVPVETPALDASPSILDLSGEAEARPVPPPAPAE
jgi:endonuclease YncB( thermonuclease family)